MVGGVERNRIYRWRYGLEMKTVEVDFNKMNTYWSYEFLEVGLPIHDLPVIKNNEEIVIYDTGDIDLTARVKLCGLNPEKKQAYFKILECGKHVARRYGVNYSEKCRHDYRVPFGALCSACVMRDEKCIACGKRLYHLGEYK